MKIGIGVSLAALAVLGGEAGSGLGSQTPLQRILALSPSGQVFLDEGIDPIHWFDFVADRCLYNNADVGGVSGATGYSFARASAGYYTNLDGTLTSFASGALRRGNRGVLIEGARTNLLQRSQEFENIYWSKTNVTITTSGDAPDGTPTARLCTVNTTAATNTVLTTANAVAITGTSCAATIFVKRGANVEPTGAFLLRDQTAGVNKITGTVTWATMAIVGVGASIRRLGTTDWYRITLLDTSWTSTNTAVLYFGTTGGSYTAGHSWYIWGAQLEAASFPSSYIPTTTASATRAADVLTCTAGVSYPLSLWAEFEPDDVVGTGYQNIFQAATDANSRADIGKITNDGYQAVANAGVEVAGFNQSATGNVDTLAAGVSRKFALRAETNNTRSANGGTLVGSNDTVCAMPSAPVLLRFGTDQSSRSVFGYIRRAAIFNSALSDGNLTSVTS